MSQVFHPDFAEASIAPANPDEDIKEEYTIRLNAEGQARLVELIETPNPKAPSAAMLRAQERRARYFDASH